MSGQVLHADLGILLVGINYDKNRKNHECVIEKLPAL